ncbi:hypothetical protein BJF86_10725 [Serinicoccus sp. CNJ-927]|nr:hypothetical protein BJF86_10725 [Serinicoccus sp. CNJ-927]
MTGVTPGTLTRRLCATTLLAQAMSVFFGTLVAWRLAGTTGDPRAGAYLWGGLVLTALCVLAAGALRSRVGILLGWLAQFLTLAAGLVLPAMLVVAGLFGFLWWLCLSQGTRMDRLTAQRQAQAGDPATDNTVTDREIE